MQEAFALKSTGAVTNGISNSPAFRLPDDLASVERRACNRIA